MNYLDSDTGENEQVDNLTDEEKTKRERELAKKGIENFLEFFNEKTGNVITYQMLQGLNVDPLESIITEFTCAKKFPSGKVGLFRNKMKFFPGTKKYVVELHDIMDLTKSFDLNSEQGSDICAAQQFILRLLAVIKKYLYNTIDKKPIEITTSGSILGSGFERTLRKCMPVYSSVEHYFKSQEGGSKSRCKPARKTTRKSKSKTKTKTYRRRRHSRIRKHKKYTSRRRR